jgi:hypothetical protein
LRETQHEHIRQENWQVELETVIAKGARAIDDCLDSSNGDNQVVVGLPTCELVIWSKSGFNGTSQPNTTTIGSFLGNKGWAKFDFYAHRINQRWRVLEGGQAARERQGRIAEDAKKADADKRRKSQLSEADRAEALLEQERRRQRAEPKFTHVLKFDAMTREWGLETIETYKGAKPARPGDTKPHVVVDNDPGGEDVNDSGETPF